MTKYQQDFYSTRHERTVYAARTILRLVLDRLSSVNSAIDVGCGVGTWLSVLIEMGVLAVRGLDGPWVDESLLVIPRGSFVRTDLSKPIPVKQRYDLAISLEVAEHVPPQSEAGYVDALTGFSDFVLFSAAIPAQGGVGHVNERWQQYWVERFEARKFVLLDFVRPYIWNDAAISFWYRQNVLFFARQSVVHLVQCGPEEHGNAHFPINVVHPDLFIQEVAYRSSVAGSLRLVGGAVKKAFFRGQK
jgi:hypothetical protein